tara:strand:- start:2646 stop:3299 length:654 start_codon:yes stop_codon:yes gene_type:complete
MNLIVFSLNAVARFPHEEIENCMRQALIEFGIEPNNRRHFPQDLNILQAFKAYFKTELDQSLSDEQMELLIRHFSNKVKNLFLSDDDLFEIRPGVQSLFGEIEKQKSWKYAILSHLDFNTTRFVLQSCGVFSKDKLTLSAEEGKNYQEQISRLIKRVQKSDKPPKVHFFSLDKDESLAREISIILPKKSKKEKNYFTYRRFEEYFKKAKKNKKKKNK